MGTGITCYSGDRLKEYVQAMLTGVKEERDFVDECMNLIRCSGFRKVISVSGLRGVGKTVGMLQMIQNIRSYDDTAFLNIEKTISCTQLNEFMLDNMEGKKYIFIDEITKVENLLTDSAFLHDRYTGAGIKVIISGTDSLGILKSSSSALYHRVFNISCTFISYPEAERTCGMSFSHYILMGGLYQSERLDDLDSLCQYVDTAVVDNVLNTLNRNSVISATSGLSEMAKNTSKIRAVIFMVFYAVVYQSMKGIRGINISRIFNVFDTMNEDFRTLNKEVCERLGLSDEIQVQPFEVNTILDTLLSLGILCRIENLYSQNEMLYYITNPAMNNQVIYSIVSSMKDMDFRIKKNQTLKPVHGLTFESIVICHTYYRAKHKGYDVYYYRDSESREIDMIIGNMVMDEFSSTYLCFEIKMTDSADTAVVKSKWINNSDIYNILKENGQVAGRGIIYGGDSFEKFSGFGKEVTPPKGMTVEEIEEQNKGIQLIPVEDYLKNIDEVFSVLENHEF